MLKNRWLLPYQLAWRFLFGKQQSAYVKFLIRICIASIFLGTVALCVTLMIMSGFEQKVRQKARGMHSHAFVSAAAGGQIDFADTAQHLTSKFPSLIQGVSATSGMQVIIDHANTFYTLGLKAIDAASFTNVSEIAKFITPYLAQTGTTQKKPRVKSIDLTKILQGNNILIGHKVAKALDLKLGDSIKLLLPEICKNRVKLKDVTATIAGFIDVGFYEFDAGTVMCSLNFFWQFNANHGQVDYVLINFASQEPQNKMSVEYLKYISDHLWHKFSPWAPDEEMLLAQNLAAQQPHLKIQVWQELYPALLSSMRLEKYAMFLVLFLISVVAIMNMIALLVVQVQTKRKDIVILQVLGFDRSFIRKIFTTLGLCLTFFACGAGLVCAATIGYICTYISPLQLPDAYLVSYLPFDLSLSNFVLVGILTMITGFLAAWIPAHRANNLDVIQVLKDS